ncbi:MAG: hypothetical protein IJ410_08095 [Oscillospiraceae bacterium]|nr:hypothetical protein [Oscillospiraceae bacterium]
MKKGKIAVITACAVVLILGGIIGLSKVFETSWQNENIVENSLNVNMDNTTIYSNLENSEFDYPFLTEEECVNKKDDAAYIRYRDAVDPLWKSQLNWAIEKRANRKYYYPEEGMLSFQEVANKCGEIAKYIVGYTEHTKLPAVIMYYPADSNEGISRVSNGYDFTGEPYFYYYFLNENKDKALQFVLNAITGKVIMINVDGEILVEYIEDLDYYYYLSKPSSEICIELDEQTEHVMNVLGISKKIVKRNYYFNGAKWHTVFNGGCYVYYTESIMDDGEVLTVGFITDDKETFQFSGYCTKQFIKKIPDEDIIYKHGHLTDEDGNIIS